MGQNRKVTNYEELEQAYITKNATYQQLADQAGVSLSAIGQYAKRNDWRGKKIAYEQAITRRSMEQVAASVAHERSTIRNEAIMVVRASLRKYVQDVMAGHTNVTAKDAAAFVQLLMTDLVPADPKESDGATTLIVSGDADAEFVRGVVEAARGRVPAAVGVGENLLDGTSKSRPN